MRFNIEIDKNLEIRIWEKGFDFPCVYQPVTPDGKPWASMKEAEKWANEWVARTMALAEEVSTVEPLEVTDGRD